MFLQSFRCLLCFSHIPTPMLSSQKSFHKFNYLLLWNPCSLSSYLIYVNCHFFFLLSLLKRSFTFLQPEFCKRQNCAFQIYPSQDIPMLSSIQRYSWKQLLNTKKKKKKADFSFFCYDSIRVHFVAISMLLSWPFKISLFTNISITYSYYMKKLRSWSQAREMDQWVKHLQCKYEEKNLNPHKPL